MPERFVLAGNAGAVGAVTLAVPGGRIVADRMVGDRGSATAERSAMRSVPASARARCPGAAAVRPFTRLRRFDTAGRVRWQWNLARDGVALALPTGLDRCLSPGGTRLAVQMYDTRPDHPLAPAGRTIGYAVIGVGPDDYGFVRQKDARPGEALGNPRLTAPVGWRPGAPATLDYETGANSDTPQRRQGDFSAAPTR